MAVQQVVLISVATFSALAICALTYHLDILSLAEAARRGEALNWLDGNTTDTSALTAGVWTTSTTTLPPEEQKYEETTQLIISIVVALVSVFLGFGPAKLVANLYHKPFYYQVVRLDMKKQIMKKWGRDRSLGNMVSAFLLVVSVGFLAFFAVQTNEENAGIDERQKEFLVSATIIVAWKFFIWPAVPISFNFFVVVVARLYSWLDDFVEAVVPHSTWDFTMFTADNAAEQARQLGIMKNCHKRASAAQEAAAEAEALAAGEDIPKTHEAQEQTFMQVLGGIIAKQIRGRLHKKSSS